MQSSHKCAGIHPNGRWWSVKENCCDGLVGSLCFVTSYMVARPLNPAYIYSVMYCRHHTVVPDSVIKQNTSHPQTFMQCTITYAAGNLNCCIRQH